MTDTPEPTASTPTAPRYSPAEVAKARRTIGTFAVVAVAVVGLCIYGMVNSQADAPDGYDAQVACKDFVRDRLKSPSAADFSGLSHSGSGNTWTVTGTVDAPNSFNAPVRSTFTCKVRIDGDTWHLLSLTGLN